MIIIADATWPLESQEEVGKRFPLAPQLPDHMTMRGPYVCADGAGYRAITLYEFDEPKMADAVFAIASRFAVYNGVKGYIYKAQVFAEPGEAQKRVTRVES
jgi:hypothetical protein